MSLNNSLGVEDFNMNMLVSSPINKDSLNQPKILSVSSPQTDKMHYLRSINNTSQINNTATNNRLLTQKSSLDNMPLGVISGNLSIQENNQSTHRTDGQNSVSHFKHNHSLSHGHNLGTADAGAGVPILKNSFRVENRRAKPKIVQNLNDQGNAFFSKQANILNTSHKRHRRGVSSPGTEFLFLNNNEQILNRSAIVQTRER